MLSLQSQDGPDLALILAAMKGEKGAEPGGFRHKQRGRPPFFLEV